MITVLGYLTRSFLHRITEFLRHWYVESAKIYGHFFLNRLERLDYYFAWKITLRNLFEPLYKDYSLIGYILGFIFRVMRLLIASFFYIFIFSVIAIFYLIWFLIPVFLIYKILFS